MSFLPRLFFVCFVFFPENYAGVPHLSAAANSSQRKNLCPYFAGFCLSFYITPRYIM